MAKKGVKRARESANVAEAAASINVKPSEVPEYLRQGSFYTSLNFEENDEAFPVPSDAMKLDESLMSSDDLVHLLKSLRFWGVDGIHPGIVDFVLNSGASRLKTSIAKFEQNYPYLFTLHEILNNPGRVPIFVPIELGDVEMLKYIYERKHTSEEVVPQIYLKYAVKQCQLECLEYLYTKNAQPSAVEIVREAVWGGNLDCLKCVERHTPNFAQILPTKGWPRVDTTNLEVFLYCFRLNQEINMLSVDDAFFCGGVDTARRCVEEAGVQIRPVFTASAVEHDRLDILEYLLELGCAWDPWTCPTAAEAGNLKLLRFAHEHGGVLAPTTILAALSNNHVNCLQYAHDNGCPWPRYAYSFVSSKQSCYKYLVKHGCPRFEEPDDLS